MIRWAMLRVRPKGTLPVKSWRNWTGSPRPTPGHQVENAVRNSLHDLPSAPEALPRGWTTLRRRLMLIITVALLPVVVVSMFQGVERVRRDVGDVRAQLTTSAKNAAENYQSVFRSGEQIRRAVGSITDVRAMTGNCDSILADAMVGVSYFTNLSRVDGNGTLRCSALTLAKGINIRDIGTFQAAKKANGALVVSPLLLSRATGMQVVGSQLGLKRADGGFDGTLAITLDLHWFDYLLRQQPIPAGVVM